MNKKSAQRSPGSQMSQPLRSSLRDRILRWRVIGAVIFTLSFIAQNAILPLATEDQQMQMRGQLVLDLEQTRRDIWRAGLILLSRADSLDANVETQFLVEFLRAEKNLIVWSAGRAGAGTQEYSRKLLEREAEYSLAVELADSGDVEGIRVLANRAALQASFSLPYDDQRYFSLVDDTRSRMQFWYWVFLLGYFAGCVSVGIGYLRDE